MSSTPTPMATPTKTGANNEQNQKLLEALIRQIPDKGLDWNKVAEDMGCTAGAARERWRRYKIANNITTVAAPADGTTPVKKSRTPKRKAEAADGDDAAATPVKKTSAKKAKVVKSDEKANDEDEASEVTSPVVKKKATPKKTPAKPKAKPEPKVEVALVEEEEDVEAEDVEAEDVEAEEDADSNGSTIVNPDVKDESAAADDEMEKEDETEA